MVAALADHVGDWSRRLVKSKLKIGGKLEQHEFDLGIGNGTPLVAVQVLAFHNQSVRKDIDATAWLLADVQREMVDRKLRVAVISTSAEDQPEAAERANRIFGELEAETIPIADVGAWTIAVAQNAGLIEGVADGSSRRPR